MTLRKKMDCPACAGQRLHTEPEWNEHHPYRGHGYTRESGWSHPELKADISTATIESCQDAVERKFQKRLTPWSGPTVERRNPDEATHPGEAKP